MKAVLVPLVGLLLVRKKAGNLEDGAAMKLLPPSSSYS